MKGLNTGALFCGPGSHAAIPTMVGQQRMTRSCVRKGIFDCAFSNPTQFAYKTGRKKIHAYKELRTVMFFFKCALINYLFCAQWRRREPFLYYKKNNRVCRVTYGNPPSLQCHGDYGEGRGPWLPPPASPRLGRPTSV